MRVFPEFEGPMAKWSHLETMPYAKETLSKLRSNWSIGLATNAIDSSESEIRQALALVNLNDIIERVYCYKRIGYRKPTPAFFEFIMSDLGLKPENIFMIGDSYEEDVLGANRSGIRAVWFNNQSGEERSGDLHKTIHDLRDLPKVLHGWDLESSGR